jgi:hypothetical protein
VLLIQEIIPICGNLPVKKQLLARLLKVVFGCFIIKMS